MLTLTTNDILNLQALVAGAPVAGSVTGVRDLSGLNNNLANPTFGTAGTAFLRITTPSYGAPIYTDVNGVSTITQLSVNPIFTGLDPRAISNLVGVQDITTPVQSAGANVLFSAFGQYFDHGLAASLKGTGATIQIGDPGTGRTPGTNNPADLTRTPVAGFDVAGTPLHTNNTSAFIDQNQAYGANLLVGTFLRQTDGLGGVTAKLAVGGVDASNAAFDQLPTLRQLIHAHWDNNTAFTLGAGTVNAVTVKFRDYYSGLVDNLGQINDTIANALYKDFMGSGQPIFVDLNPFISPLDHAVGGDGRANENITLTAMHTIWARNHNMHVDTLLAAGFTGSDEAVFQAAKIINETEYQRVIYTDFADTLLGGMQGSGSHGFDQYSPRVNAGISQEFNAAAYRFGHSMVGQTVQILDATNQMQSIKLFDAFLNPGNDGQFTLTLEQLQAYGYVPQPGYAQIGTNSIVAGIAAQAAEEVDAQVVDAIRNDLVRVSADLFSLNVARGRDLGLGTLNQVRQSLLDSQDAYVVDSITRSGVDLTTYTSWEDFQTRNQLSDATIAKFREAYPDLVLTSAQEIADFQQYNPGITLVNGNTVQGIDRMDLWVGGIAESHVNGGVVGGTFWVIIHEQLDRLQEADRFYYFERVKDFDFYDQITNLGFAGVVARTTGINYTGNIFTVVQPPDLAPPIPVDAIAPTLDGFMPDLGTVDVAVASSIVVRFSEAVRANLGSIELRTATGQTVETFDTTTSTRLLFVGNTLTVDPTADLQPGQTYVLVISAGAVTDLAGNAYQGTAPLEFSTLAHWVGTARNDLLRAGAGDDRLDGLAGNDQLVGLAGNDTLDGGAGNDTLVGGQGNDLYRVDSARDVVTELMGEGTDTIETTLTSYSLSPNARTHIENLTFIGSGNFIGTGNELGNLITGGQGNDTLDGGVGADTLVGGAGNDLYMLDHLGDVVLELDAGGIDTVSTSLGHALADFIENLTLTGNTNTNGTGNALSNTITGNAVNNGLSGGAGNDTLNGGAGNDTLDGGLDNDVLDGGTGNDRLAGGLGADTMTGGTGNDVFVFTATDQSGTANLTRDLITDFTRGQDLIDVSGISGSFSFIGTAAFTGTNQLRYTVNVNGQTVIEANTVGNNSADFSVALGTVFNTLTVADFVGAQVVAPVNGGNGVNGVNGINTLNGTNGADTLRGRANNDVINGLGGNDVLNGGAGSDVLNGGLGQDTLTGGTGNDFFVFNTALGNANRDVITDFSNSNGNNDTFRLDNANGLFTRLQDGNLNAAAFHVGRGATTAAQRIVYDNTTGNLFYDADGNASGAQVLFATLSNRATLTAADFVVI